MGSPANVGLSIFPDAVCCFYGEREPVICDDTKCLIRAVTSDRYVIVMKV